MRIPTVILGYRPTYPLYPQGNDFDLLLSVHTPPLRPSGRSDTATEAQMLAENSNCLIAYRCLPMPRSRAVLYFGYQVSPVLEWIRYPTRIQLNRSQRTRVRSLLSIHWLLPRI